MAYEPNVGSKLIVTVWTESASGIAAHMLGLSLLYDISYHCGML